MKVKCVDGCGPKVRRALSIRTYLEGLGRHPEDVRNVNDAAGRASLGCELERGDGKRASTRTGDMSMRRVCFRRLHSETLLLSYPRCRWGGRRS